MGYIIGVVATALIAIVTNYKIFGKIVSFIREFAEFVTVLNNALKPDEDGKVRITAEEAERLIKEAKDLLNVFSKK